MLYEFLIVCPLVFLAGLVDAIAGGGGLISLPAYMFAGIPVHNAIATNKLSSATGTAVSAWHLVKNGCVDLFLIPGTVISTFIGSIAGANLALIVSDRILKTVLICVLPVVAVCVFRDKELTPVIPEGFTRKKQYISTNYLYSGRKNFLDAWNCCICVQHRRTLSRCPDGSIKRSEDHQTDHSAGTGVVNGQSCVCERVIKRNRNSILRTDVL